VNPVNLSPYIRSLIYGSNASINANGAQTRYEICMIVQLQICEFMLKDKYGARRITATETS